MKSMKCRLRRRPTCICAKKQTACSLQDAASAPAPAHTQVPSAASYTIELDLFREALDGITLAEVEFSSIEEAESFIPPDWFGEDVTYDGRYHNSAMSRGSLTGPSEHENT